MSVEIPKEPVALKVNADAGTVETYDEAMSYTDAQGNKVDVCLWVQYPSYDFIFGVPAEGNPKKTEEVGFFQFRDTRAKEIRQGFYVDCQELEEMLEGFRRVYEMSRKTNPKIWKKYEAKNK